MTTKAAPAFGPRLIGSPTGTLRAAMLVRPSRAIERAKPLPGEPGTVHQWALDQHAILCKTLAFFGVETVVMDSRDEDPYETAVCDAAVAFEDGAMLMRPTAMARRGEADRLKAQFSHIDVPLAGHVTAPGLLDGSDVLLVGQTAFVGVGKRGNDVGRNGFTQVANAHGYRVVEVKIDPSVPSLRAVAGAIAKDTVVIAADRVDRGAFEGFRTIALERGEDLAAGVVPIGDKHVIADIRYKTALKTMRRAGITVEAIDLYEYGKIGLTPSMLVLALKRN